MLSRPPLSDVTVPSDEWQCRGYPGASSKYHNYYQLYRRPDCGVSSSNYRHHKKDWWLFCKAIAYWSIISCPLATSS